MNETHALHNYSATNILLRFLFLPGHYFHNNKTGEWRKEIKPYIIFKSGIDNAKLNDGEICEQLQEEKQSLAVCSYTQVKWRHPVGAAPHKTAPLRGLKKR